MTPDLIRTYNRFSALYFGSGLSQTQIFAEAKAQIKFLQSCKQRAAAKRARYAAHRLHPTPLEAIKDFLKTHSGFTGLVDVASYAHDGRGGYHKRETIFKVEFFPSMDRQTIKQIKRGFGRHYFNLFIDIRQQQLSGDEPSIVHFPVSAVTPPPVTA